MFGLGKPVELRTERLTLRPARTSDYPDWARARRDSREFLSPWEPTWAPDHLTRRAFRHRVVWGRRAIRLERAWPFLMFLDSEQDGHPAGSLVGAVTLDNVRRGPAQSATIGYWTAEPMSRRGYMREALEEVRRFAYEELELGRLEAGCLPENKPSRALLESCGFKYEGVAQAYLQIDGRWRDHVLYASLRHDRRGRAETPEI